MKHILLRVCRKICRRRKKLYTNQRVQYSGQKANDFISDSIKNNKDGLMISKFGTIELNNVCCFLTQRNVGIRDVWNTIRGDYTIFPDEALEQLCHNAGFFPKDRELWKRYNEKVLKDMSLIDILASYQFAEDKVENFFGKCTNVDLDGYYAPFLWDNPWTKQLKGKRVLVIHPFTESIKQQYLKREKLFSNTDVLPEFKELILIKAVQSMADNTEHLSYSDWFKALESMEMEMDSNDYDVALIGCGAYGMELAAHAKKRGKIGIHLAGWTQMLFGIYGNRWLVDQPEYSRFINEYWIRPSKGERPKGADTVENGCYW